MSESAWIVESGLVPYNEALEAQRLIGAARQRDEVPDTLLLLEHLPVYTRGRRSEAAEMPMGVQWYEAQGIEVRDTDRGGRVTYHGPGQLVAYPIVKLLPGTSSEGASATGDPPSGRMRPGVPGSQALPASRPGTAGSPKGRGFDVHGFVRLLERVMIAALSEWEIDAGTIPGLTGVWTKPQPRPTANRDTPGSEAEDMARGDSPRKIGSIGIHVSRGVTTHGLAINVNNDLQPFEWIVPCGIDDCRVTSVGRELGAEQDLAAFSQEVGKCFGAELARPLEPLSPGELAERVAGLQALSLGAASGTLP